MLWKVVILLAVAFCLLVLYGRLMGRTDKEVTYPGVTEAVRAKISSEVSSGRKISAIKIYRQATGAPLPEAKRAIDNWFTPGRGSGVVDAANSVLNGRMTVTAREKISRLVASGQIEQAEHLYAEATGASASEARAMIRTWDIENSH